MELFFLSFLSMGQVHYSFVSTLILPLYPLIYHPFAIFLSSLHPSLHSLLYLSPSLNSSGFFLSIQPTISPSFLFHLPNLSLPALSLLTSPALSLLLPIAILSLLLPLPTSYFFPSQSLQSHCFPAFPCYLFSTLSPFLSLLPLYLLFLPTALS